MYQNATCHLRLTGDGYPDMLVGELAFSWSIQNAFGKQKAYRITVMNSKTKVKTWDSGWVQTMSSATIDYAGEALCSNTAYVAQVEIETEEDQRIKSEPEAFWTGLLNDEEWKGEWLCSPYALLTASAPMFRKEMELPKRIVQARLFICGLGYYELYINDQKIGDRYMDPAWTDYRKRVNYVAYDVTKFVVEGNNVFGVCLGTGWYANFDAMPKPAFTAQLMLDMEDGTSVCLPTRHGDGWMTLKDSPMQYNTIYIGETFDRRLWPDGWTSPEYDPSVRTWQPALESEAPLGKLTPMRIEPIRVIREIPAITVSEPQEQVYVVDFGQNLAGIVRLTLKGCETGDKIQIRYAEILDDQGMLSTLNLRGAQARDIYYAAGLEQEIYQSRFTYHGFRYAEVTGLKQAMTAEQIVALPVRNDVLTRSTFETSSEFINTLQKMCVWTESNNLHGVPTDCPQRDERLGWLNDLTVRLEESMYNFDMDRFLRKFLVDIRDAQGKHTGAIPDTVPYVLYGGQPADPVCSSYLLIPYMIYLHYGDLAPLIVSYDGLKGWTDYLLRQRENGLVPFSYFGDWASPVTENVMHSVGSSAVSAITPGTMVSTCFLNMDCRLMAYFALLLGKTEDEARYSALAVETADALNQAFLHKDEGFYAGNSQAANTLMLYLDIVPKQYKNEVFAHLCENILAHDTHLTTGNLCTRYILDVLADHGQIDLAYALVTQTTYPSWGYMMSRGATTTWERWEYVDSGELIGMASHDHPMYSTVSGWFYKYLAGFRPLQAGFERYELRPFFPSKLDHASACVKTVKGEASIEWMREGEELKLQLHVPFNSVCHFTVTLPGCKSVVLNGQVQTLESAYELESGDYTLLLK